MRRAGFIRILAGSAGGAVLLRHMPATAGDVDLRAPLRVRLFAAMDLNLLTINDVVIDARRLTVTSSRGTQPLGSSTVEFSGTPLLYVTAADAAGTQVQRQYTGPVCVQALAEKLLAVNIVDVETYVSSVMSAEMSAGWPPEALQAQAIAIRTFAVVSRIANALRPYDLKDDTSSQVYPGVGSITQPLMDLAAATSGQAVFFQDAPASIFYSSSCGGHTAASEELTGKPSPSYLGGITDADRGVAYCSQAPYFQWTNRVDAQAMSRVVRLPPEQLGGVHISERWPDGRVKTIVAGNGVSLSGREFYKRALDVLGYKVVPSALFDISPDGSEFAFVGHGVGHGVGMCQWGARGRALAGMTAAQILGAYFPGTHIVNTELHSGDGIQHLVFRGPHSV